VRTLDRIVGTRFFSVKRFVFVIAFNAVLLAIMLVQIKLLLEDIEPDGPDAVLPLLLDESTQIWIAFTVALFSFSLSFTRFYSLVVARLCGDGPVRNFLVFVAG